MIEARVYDVFVILGSAGHAPPWLTDVWSEIAFHLDPLLSGAMAPVGVRTTQLSASPAVASARLNFGRLGWSRASWETWTHPQEGRLASGAPAFFLSAEVWAPIWTRCARRPPDVFVCLANQRHLGGRVKAPPGEGFDNVFILACAADLSRQNQRFAEQASAEIAALLDAPLRARARRPWSETGALPGRRMSAINDLAITGLFKTGPRHGFPPELSMLEGGWTAF